MPSLSVQDLLTIQQMPAADALPLQTIALFYEEHFCGRQFVYDISHKKREIRLRFKPGDLCHLLGIHHILKGKENTGEPGFLKLKDGTNTHNVLVQKAAVGAYEDMQYRILYFPFVYQLIHNPVIVVSDQNDIVTAQFVFHDHFGQRYVELKLRAEHKDHPNFYVPVTFNAVRKVKGRAQIRVRGISVVDYDAGY